MVHSWAKRMASVFVLHGETTEENADIYTYACEQILSVLVNIVSGLVIAVIFGRLLEGVVFIAGFALLRRYTGGYHAKTHFGCIATFSVVLICALVLLSAAPDIAVGYSIGFAAASAAWLLIFWFGTVGNQKRSDSENDCRVMRKKSRFCVTVFWLICFVDYFVLGSRIGLVVPLVMVSVFGSMAYAIAYKHFMMKEVKEYGETKG